MLEFGKPTDVRRGFIDNLVFEAWAPARMLDKKDPLRRTGQTWQPGNF